MSESHNCYLLRKPWHERVIASSVGKDKAYLKTPHMREALDHLNGIGKFARFRIGDDGFVCGYEICDYFNPKNFTEEELKAIGKANIDKLRRLDAVRESEEINRANKWHSNMDVVDIMLIVVMILNATVLVLAAAPQ